VARWGMVIDLLRCVQCYACQISCKQAYALPPGVFYCRLLVGETGKYPAVRKLTYPVLCNHCKEAACIDVCPTDATTRREDGIVTINADKCMGCRYCLIACPYQARTFYNGDSEYFPGQGFTDLEKIGRELHPLHKGTVIKCTFCAERIDSSLERGLKPGVDRDATPICVNACPSRARYFGDLDDPESNVSKLIREKKGEQLEARFETVPSVYYLDY